MYLRTCTYSYWKNITAVVSATKMFLHNKAAIASQWGSGWRFGPFNLQSLALRGLEEVEREEVKAGKFARVAEEKAERLALKNARRGMRVRSVCSKFTVI